MKNTIFPFESLIFICDASVIVGSYRDQSAKTWKKAELAKKDSPDSEIPAVLARNWGTVPNTTWLSLESLPPTPGPPRTPGPAVTCNARSERRAGGGDFRPESVGGQERLQCP